jgi:hypothetical protein
MRTIGISHKTRYWQHHCFGHPPEGHRYVRALDMPWHLTPVRSEFLAHSKWFLPLPRVHLYHTYNAIVTNRRPWLVEVESSLPRYKRMDHGKPLYRWALRRLADDHCKAILFTSRNTRALNEARLTAAGTDPAKMHVLYRAVECHDRILRPGQPFTVLFAGNGLLPQGRGGTAEGLPGLGPGGRPVGDHQHLGGGLGRAPCGSHHPCHGAGHRRGSADPPAPRTAP